MGSKITAKGSVVSALAPSEFGDLIGFIKQFMYWAISHLTTRRALRGVVENGRF